MSGTLGVLSVGAGHLKISFNKDNEEERRMAAETVVDLLCKGYVLLVMDKEGLYHRVDGFDPETCEYLIVEKNVAFTTPTEIKVATQEKDTKDSADHETASEDEGNQSNSTQSTSEWKQAPTLSSDGGSSKGIKSRKGRKRIDASTVSGVAVARSSGG